MVRLTFAPRFIFDRLNLPGSVHCQNTGEAGAPADMESKRWACRVHLFLVLSISLNDRGQ